MDLDTRRSYATGIDFTALALQSSEFGKYLNAGGQLDFKDPRAVKQLTISLLKRDFNLDLELPDDRLCPPVPNRWDRLYRLLFPLLTIRLNYVLWIQTLLDTTSPCYDGQITPTIGLDIGTGASCIYPLLACSLQPNWRFVATDIDEKNFNFATQNVFRNRLDSRITVQLRDRSSSLIPDEDITNEGITFTMCNPPFYSSKAELLSSAATKLKPPNSTCTGSDVEMVTNGGEVEFVSRIISESTHFKERIRWYSSMLGKISSVIPLVSKLKSVGVDNWAVTELLQGTKTRRWALAWSWQGLRPPENIARLVPSLPKQALPLASQRQIRTFKNSLPTVEQAIEALLRNLGLEWRRHGLIHEGLVSTTKNVWSRAARRNQSRGSGIEGDDRNSTFMLKLDHEDEVVLVDIRWMEGHDPLLFESFCGMLKREINA